MINCPLSIILYSDNLDQKSLNTQLDVLVTAVRPKDQIFLVTAIDKIPSKSSRVSVIATLPLSEGINRACELSSAPVVLILSARGFITKLFLDQVRQCTLVDSGAVVGPRSNGLPGYQAVPGIGYKGRSAMRQVAAEWSDSHRGFFSSSPFLASDALWSKREVIASLLKRSNTSVSSVDFAWEMARIASTDSIPFLVDDFVYLHIDGTTDYQLRLSYGKGSLQADAKYTKWASRTDKKEIAVQATGIPFSEVVSLSMIVRDEELNLEKAISSAAPFVESIHILDTGSCDNTINIAIAAGAIVNDFVWENDFGKARQFALECTRSDWVFVLDADETLEVDSDRALVELGASIGVQSGFTIEIANVDELALGTSVRNQMARVLRRVDARWVGQIHEQITSRSSHMLLTGCLLEAAKIIHSGYSQALMDSKSKTERNLSLAKDYAERVGTLEAKIHLSRSLVMAGRISESLELMAEIALNKKLDPAWLPVVYRHLIDNNLATREVSEAKRWHIEFRTRFPDRADQQAREMLILCSLDRISEALEIYRSLPDKEVYTGDIQFSKSFFVSQLVDALQAHSKFLEAVAVVLTSLESTGYLDLHPGRVIELLQKSGVSPIEFYNRMPKDKRVVIFGLILQLGRADPNAGSQFLLSLWHGGIKDKLVLACAENFFVNCSLEQLLEWSVIYRGAGLVDRCPLISSSRSEGASLDRRIGLLYIAWVSFVDENALRELREQLVALNPLMLSEVIYRLKIELGFDISSILPVDVESNLAAT